MSKNIKLETRVTLKDISDAKGYQLYGAKAGDYYFPSDDTKRGYGNDFFVTGIHHDIESQSLTVLKLLRAAYVSGIRSGEYRALRIASERIGNEFFDKMLKAVRSDKEE